MGWKKEGAVVTARTAKPDLVAPGSSSSSFRSARIEQTRIVAARGITLGGGYLTGAEARRRARGLASPFAVMARHDWLTVSGRKGG
jgi:hypothetical protein